MELRHVRYFIAVAEYLNFSKAAQQLHIAQPPLSRQIRQLEEALGVTLFMRDKRRVALTKAGQVFLGEARKLVLQAGHAMEAARHAQKGESGIVRIGIASGLGGLIRAIIYLTRPLVFDTFSLLENEDEPRTKEPSRSDCLLLEF